MALVSSSFYLTSLSALQEYLRHRPDAVTAIHCKQTIRGKVEEAVRNARLPTNLIKPLDEKVGEDASPVRARVKFAPMGEEAFFKEVEPAQSGLILALDHITDPRNLGAIARSAAFFGVRYIVVPDRRQAPLTEAGFNTAQGAFAFLNLVEVTNLGRAIERLKESGFWVIGTTMEGEPLREVAGFYEKTVLVLGSEDKGMAQKIREKCDRVVAIPRIPDGLDSLNVSVAAGICLYEFANPLKGRH